mgnify:FL=1
MKRCVMICILAFLVVWCLNTDVMASKHRHLLGNAKLKSNSGFDNDIEVNVEKLEESNNVEYSIVFVFDGGLENVKKVQIKAPNSKSSLLKNSLGFDKLWFSRGSLTYEDLINKFPEGKYSIKFSPSKFGSISFNLTYDIPSTPVITYPKDGATDVPLSFTITWESMSDVDGLQLGIGGDGAYPWLEVDLATGDTSFSVPDGLLQPNTQYEIDLTAYKNSDENTDTFNSEMRSRRIISFTTGSE